jgi:alpha-tubulin suppressor-like RCC1 family protein
LFKQDVHPIDPSHQPLCSPSSPIVAFGCGWYHSYCILDDGSLYTWGYCIEGQLGRGKKGSEHDSSKPKKVGLKVRVPLLVSWGCFQWLFLGRLDEESKLFGLPVEVVFHVLKAYSRY